MNNLHEAVTLPTRAVKELLHPTELPEARNLHARGWWFGRLSSLPVVAAIGAVAWAISGNLFAMIIAPLSSLVVGLVASRWFVSRAWDYIPRRRQDKNGAPRWRLSATLIDAVALLVIAAAIILVENARPMPEGVVAFATGASIGVALIQFGELIAGLVQGTGSNLAWRRLILLVAVTVSAVSLGVFGLDAEWGRETFVIAGMGAASTLLAYAIWWGTTALHERRTARRQDVTGGVSGDAKPRSTDGEAC